MNSKERKELRYLRRKEKREKKIIETSNKYSNINNAFQFHKVMYYSDKCCNGVRWKKSTKLFIMHQFNIIANTCNNIKNNTYKVNNTYNFTINERGKTRNIDAPIIKDRLIHKVISNEIITPIYERHLIYDNGASIKDKGFKFTIDRVKYKLRKYYNKYNNNGYVVLIDYKSFFQNISHDIINKIHIKYIRNNYTIKVIEDYLFIKEGIPLGVEIAQKEASIVPNILDHYISNQNKYFIRYMDDSIFFINDFDKAVNLLNNYKDLSKEYNIIINNNKTKIIDVKDSFIFCKWKYLIKENGKIIMIPIKKTLYRQRRKLNKMKELRININEIEIVKTSFNAYISYSNKKKIQNKLNLYKIIIIFYLLVLLL